MHETLRTRLLLMLALLHASFALRPLYPVKQALRTGKHAVAGGVHTLYYEEHGKDGGAPALFLHGGPGAGCSQRHAGFFDPAHYQVVLFDQRGCGRSAPKGCLEENETPQLIADIEELRSAPLRLCTPDLPCAVPLHIRACASVPLQGTAGHRGVASRPWRQLGHHARARLRAGTPESRALARAARGLPDAPA